MGCHSVRNHAWRWVKCRLETSWVQLIVVILFVATVLVMLWLFRRRVRPLWERVMVSAQKNLKHTLLCTTVTVLQLTARVFVVAFQGLFFVGREVVLILRNHLSECILLGCLSTVNYYQTPYRVFVVTLVLHVLDFLWVTLTADFETPLKRLIKVHSSLKARQFLVNVLNIAYFDCSNPIEKKVMKTGIVLLPRSQLNIPSPFTLTRFNRNFYVTPSSQEGYKVQQFPVGLSHTSFTIVGAGGAQSILVETTDRLSEQKEVLEYIARYPEACLAKELHLDSKSRFRHGKYLPFEDYPDLLAEDIYVCEFQPGPSANYSPSRLEWIAEHVLPTWTKSSRSQPELEVVMF